MMGNTAFDEINEAKACMDHVYDQFDPRAYFRELKKLGYAIPSAAKPIFQNLIGHLQQRRDDTVHVLDLGCSYGVNAALLKHDMSMPELYQHWGQNRQADETPEEFVEYHQRFFDDLDEPEDIEVIGLDVAENAVAFAKEIGLLDVGLAINLETQPLPASAEEELALVDLVTSTGCVGYVTEKSFERLLPAITRDRQPWIANFVLRMFPFDAIEETLSGRGYITEKLEGQTYVQRAFASVEEQGQVLEQLREEGIDPTGKEAEGDLLAEFYLSRPIKDAAEVPIERLFAA
ncbi:MAG: class I SAM-dependent methyltransferase [Alphaproteobacteria bacterium]|nr:class I SAM-dependent methyltransferase [Alphaproteobacteria bacterium]